MAEEVILKLNNNIAIVKFNRPEVLNAMNEDFGKCLIDVSQKILSSKSLKCIVLRDQEITSVLVVILICLVKFLTM